MNRPVSYTHLDVYKRQDQYSVIGEITHIEEKKNSFTGEMVYDLTLDCNDMLFHVLDFHRWLHASQKSYESLA